MHVLRRILAATAAVLAVLTLTAAQISRVAYRQAFDTDSFVSLADKLVETPDIRTKVADSLVEQVMGKSSIGESLDPRALQLIGLTAAQVDEKIAAIVRTSVETVLGSNEFATAWSSATRSAHQSLTAAINSEASTPPPVELDLSPVMVQLSSALASTTGKLSNVVEFDKLVPADGSFTFEFIPADTIKDIRDAATATRILRTAASVASIIFLATAVVLPIKRRNGIRLASGAVAFSAILVLAARSAGTGAVRDAAGDNADIATTLYRAVSDPLTTPAVVLLVLAASAAALTVVRRGQASGNT